MDSFDSLIEYGYANFDNESDAQNFAGLLIWKEIPFKVSFKLDGTVVVRDMRNCEDDGK